MRLEAENADYEALKDFISGEANQKFIHDGDIESGYGWAGQVAGLIEDVPSVEELFERMVKEAEEIRNGWNFK